MEKEWGIIAIHSMMGYSKAVLISSHARRVGEKCGNADDQGGYDDEEDVTSKAAEPLV